MHDHAEGSTLASSYSDCLMSYPHHGRATCDLPHIALARRMPWSEGEALPATSRQKKQGGPSFQGATFERKL
jgi:hypothetical protein